MSSYPNAHFTMSKFIPEEQDMFDFEDHLCSTSPGLITMGGNNAFIASSTSFPESVHAIQGFLNSFPTPPQHTPPLHFDSKVVSNTQPARVSNVSNLTAQFHAHPEAMNYQSGGSPMHTIDSFLYQNSLPSTYSSPTGMPTGMTGLDHDHGTNLTMPWEMPIPMSPDMTSPTMEWNHAQSSAVDIPGTRRRAHRQTPSRSHSFVPYMSSPLAQHHPGNFAGGSGNSMNSGAIPRSVQNSGFAGAGFTQEQIPAAQNILQHLRKHPNSAFPATLISAELAEVMDGRGYCLIGNCGQERAAQKANPAYNPASPDDPLRKRVDHLYDHIRDKHFNCRPFQCLLCPQSFAREHDLKRHENTHNPVSLPCPLPECGKSYTRNDNLQRHIAQKHPTYPLVTRHSVF